MKRTLILNIVLASILVGSGMWIGKLVFKPKPELVVVPEYRVIKQEQVAWDREDITDIIAQKHIEGNVDSLADFYNEYVGNIELT